MRDFKGKIVFVSGGASGAGLGQAKVFGREGMKVAIGDVRQDALDNAVKELIAFGIPEKDILAIKVDLTDRKDYTACADKIEEVFGREGMKVCIADIRQDALDNAVKELIAFGIPEKDVLAIKVDLTDRASYTACADRIEEVYGGPPHLFIQTAGVNSFGPVEASTFDDFDWVMGVDLFAVVNGLLIFVPRMIKAYAHKTEFWVATTSSGGAFAAGSTCAPYSASKAGVNNLMYSYAEALKPYGAGATVLCPGNINSMQASF